MGTRRWNRALVSDLVDGSYTILSRVGQLAPQASPSHHGLDFVEDVSYREGGDPFHRLDIYRPESRQGLLPVVLYIHGGGFRSCSKRTNRSSKRGVPNPAAASSSAQALDVSSMAHSTSPKSRPRIPMRTS